MVSPSSDDLTARLCDLFAKHRTIRSVELVGSRARGAATELSDWDFEVKTADFRAAADALPALVAPLMPLAQQWDRLSAEQCYMVMLRGIGKVDLIFDEPHRPEPPWEVSAETLNGIDDHFWDWTIWLAAKDRAGKREMVGSELEKMHRHLLAPLGVPGVPSSVSDAVVAYTASREEAETRLGIAVPRAVEDEVRRLLAAGAYAI
jgi:hypothetical protein